MPTKQQILEREQRWRMIAGIAAVAGVALIIASFGDSAAAVRGGEGAAQRLTDIQDAQGKLIAAGVIQFIGWSLLAFPLGFLFKAAAARSTRIRSTLIGVVIAAPLLIGAGGLIGVASVIQASDDFVKQPAAKVDTCVEDKVSAATGSTGESDAGAGSDETGTAAAGATGTEGAASPGKDAGKGKPASGDATGGKPAGPSASQRDAYRTECEDEAAQDARRGTSLASLETGIGLAGLLGFTISVVYTALWAMRTGLLTRFWGALGLALGAVFVFFTLFTLAWFIYLGLLLVGWIPGGRPPAWAAGEAVAPPDPKGGGLFGPRRPGPGQETDDNRPVDKWGEPIEGSSEELSPDEAPEPPEAPSGDEPGSAGQTPPRRKRKKRNG